MEPSGPLDSYPDPTTETHNPYPALQHLAPGPHRVTGHQHLSHPVSSEEYIHYEDDSGSVDDPGSLAAAAKHYQILADQFRAPAYSIGRHHQGFATRGGDDVASRSGPEGMPMASDYLNLNPRRPSYAQTTETTSSNYLLQSGPNTNISDHDTTADRDVASTHNTLSDQEGTLDRGGGAAARGRGRGRGRRRGWKWALKGTEHDPARNREPQERPRGRPRGSSGRGRGGKRLDPGFDFRDKQAKATKAFVDKQYDEALVHAREAVHANPEIFAAHSLLSEILRAKGQEQDSLAALLSGAITARNPDTWIMVAERTLEFAGDDRSLESLQQAVFCYNQAIEFEKNSASGRNYEARAAKMHLWVELGEFNRARRDSKQLLAMRPDDIDNIRQLAELCAMTGDPSEMILARKAYETALELVYNDDTALAEEDLAQAWSHLNIYLELVDRTSSAAEAVVVLKRMARKLLGRQDELFWDRYQNDDREYDLTHTRRYLTGEFQQGKASRDLQRFGEGLPLELRIKLGLFRLKMGDVHRSEAMQHFEHLLHFKDDVDSLYDIFYLVGTRLRAKGEATAAVEFLGALTVIDDVLTDEFWMELGLCYKETARFEDSEHCFKSAIELNDANLNARIELARVYQDNLDETEKAWKLVDEIIAMNKKDVVKRERLQMRPRYTKSTQRQKTSRLPRMSRKRQRSEDDLEQSQDSDDEDTSADSPQPSQPSGSLQPSESTAKPASSRKRPRLSSDGPFERITKPFVPSGPGSFGGFSLTGPNDDLGIDELERREEETWENEDNREKEMEKTRKHEERTLRKEERLWRAKVAAEQKKTAKQKKTANQNGRGPSISKDQHMDFFASQTEKVLASYAVVKELWPVVGTGEDEDAIDEWMEAAVDLYEIFRSVRQFYPTRDRYRMFRGFFRLDPGEGKFLNEMEQWRKQLQGDAAAPNDGKRSVEGDVNERLQAPRVPDESVPKDFFDIDFVEWHHIFVDLALLYARQGAKAPCYEIIDNGLYGANVFYHDHEMLNTTQATSLCCGFIFNDSERLCFAVRWFINHNDYRAGMSYQLLGGVNRLCYGDNVWFSFGPTQKHMLRAVKTLDHHYLDPKYRAKFDWSLQGPSLSKRAERLGEGTGELDLGPLLLYGHMVGVANHSQSALAYFFRALALQPENVTVNLSIATMFIQNAMKRQTENRQFGICQGLSFLYRYYDLRCRSAWAIDRQEAEYNVGRTYHMLGLTHLAVKSYEKALALSERVQGEKREREAEGEDIGQEDFATEAAFSLASMYALGDNNEMARKVAEEFLVI